MGRPMAGAQPPAQDVPEASHRSYRGWPVSAWRALPSAVIVIGLSPWPSIWTSLLPSTAIARLQSSTHIGPPP